MEQAVNVSLWGKFLRVQQEISAVKKSADNPHFRSKFADLNAVLDEVKPLLTKHGLVLHQPTGKDEMGHYVETRIVDSDSGEGTYSRMYLEGTDNMQKLGAAVSYARRYTVVSQLALLTDDDDGETAVGRGPAPTKAPVTAPKAAAPKAAPKTAPAEDDKKTYALITANARVALAKKATTIADMQTYLKTTFGVEKSSDLKPAQAKEFLTYLGGLIG